MANRYQYQFQSGMKPRMSNIEGFVSIGTGGLPNSVVAIASGGSIAGNSGTYWGLLPGCATAGVPTGWAGTFSGTWGLYGAGVDGVARLATGLYSVQLSDDWRRLDSALVQVEYGAIQLAGGGATGAGGVSALDGQIVYHTVGFGNSVSTGFLGTSGLPGAQTKNQIVIQFSNPNSIVDLPINSGFYINLRLRDTQSGPQ
jgi:hypothetical protein